MRIGELLIMNGLITEQQLEIALNQQVHTPRKLGEILIENGFITERQLVEALEFQLGIPVVNMSETVFEAYAVQHIPLSIARKHMVIPIECKGGKIKVAMTDPLNHEAIKEVQMVTGMAVQPMLAARSEVEQAIMRHYGVKEAVEELNGIFESGIEKNARDIHLDTQENGISVKFRINRMLQLHKTISRHMQDAFIEHIKSTFNLSSGKQSIPQYGRSQVQLTNKHIDVRASTLPTVYGESIVLQLSDPSTEMKLSDLSFNESNLKHFEQAIQRPNGLVLVSGPSYSGKTTTLYSALRHLNKDEFKIIAVEDPMERRVSGIIQVEINEQNGLSFASGLRAVIRQDPNVVMIGDIRDAATVALAARASIAGGLVIGAIHSDSAVKTVYRLLNMGIDPYLIATSLTAVVAQRLIRRICRQCVQSVPVTEEEMRLFETHGLLQSENQQQANKGFIGNFRSLVSAQISGKMNLARATGCSSCRNSGFHGYLAIQEVLIMDEKVRGLIIQNRPIHEFEQLVAQDGFKTLLYDGLLKAREGMTTVEEVLKAVN